MNDETHDHTSFMGLALDEARAGAAEGNLAVGSVIVRGGQVIGRPQSGAHQRRSDRACRDGRDLGCLPRSRRARAAGSTCYTAMEPFPMCCWAIVVAGIEWVGPGRAACRRRQHHSRRLHGQRLIAMTRRELALITGIAVDECLAVVAFGG